MAKNGVFMLIWAILVILNDFRSSIWLSLNRNYPKLGLCNYFEWSHVFIRPILTEIWRFYFFADVSIKKLLIKKFPHGGEVRTFHFFIVGNLSKLMVKKTARAHLIPGCPLFGSRLPVILSKLNRHKAVHDRSKTVSCDVCGKVFSRVDNLNIHKKIHL